MDKTANDIRYAQLLHLLTILSGVSNTVIFCNTKIQDERMNAIKDISKNEGRLVWIDYEDDSLEYLLSKRKCALSKRPIHNPSNTNVIIAGTNTAGCILYNSELSVKKWTDLDFNVQVCLSMCADYQDGGINGAEKNQKAAVRFYRYIKKHNLISKVDMVYDANHLELRNNDDRLG
jgi:hypothetical protein